MNKILFSFGNWKFYIALLQLEETAKQKGSVDKIILLREPDIDPYFYKDHNRHFKDGRGFGYWVWKSYFINKFLETAKDDDIFFYIDSANHILGNLSPLYEACQKDEKGIILFENTDGEPTGNVWKNNMWTKSDCFNLMGLKSEEYFHGNQVNASYILFKKTDFSTSFFKTYLDFCKNYNIISDAPNITENFNTDFRDHRHDQSVLSLLAIQHKITILRDPCQWGNHRITPASTYGQIIHHHRRSCCN